MSAGQFARQVVTQRDALLGRQLAVGVHVGRGGPHSEGCPFTLGLRSWSPSHTGILPALRLRIGNVARRVAATMVMKPRRAESGSGPAGAAAGPR